jgi:hypothetical protein
MTLEIIDGESDVTMDDVHMRDDAGIESDGDVRSGDEAGGDVHMKDARTKAIRILLFRAPHDWNPIGEVNVLPGPNGEVDLRRVSDELGVKGECRVSSCFKSISI